MLRYSLSWLSALETIKWWENALYIYPSIRLGAQTGRTRSTVCLRDHTRPTFPRRPGAGWLVGLAHLHPAI